MRLLLSALCCVLLSLVKGGGGTAPQDASSTSCSPDNIPDTGVLLDSRNYDTLGGVWTANDGPAGDSNTVSACACMSWNSVVIPHDKIMLFRDSSLVPYV